MNRLRLLALALLLLAAWGCANIRAPQGGPKDVTPPLVIMAKPANGQTHFSQHFFELTFDEWVQLNDIRGQLVVSPPLQTPPTVSLSKRTVRVEWEEALRDSTTYTFYFGEGVRDFTEANAAEELSYVFSTGAVLDSLALAGQVLDAQEGEGKQGYKVLAYRQEGDTSALGTLPDYFAVSQKDGSFTFRNMAAGAYHVVALEDPNANYFLDGEEGVAHSPLRLEAEQADSTVTLHTLYAYQQPSFEPYIRDYASDSSGMAHLLPALDLADYAVRCVDTRFEQPVTWTGADTLHVQLMGAPIEDEVSLEVSWKDQIVDTLALRYYTRDARKLKPRFLERGKVDTRSTLHITHSTPLTVADSSKMYAVVDSVQVPIVLRPDSLDPRRLTYALPAPDGSSIEIVVLPGCITNAEGWVQSDTLSQSFFTHGPDHFAQLTVHLNGFNAARPGLFELIDEKGKVVLTWASSEGNDLIANRLPPATYRLRWIEDLNANAQWDAGDYRLNKQPERTVYLPESIQARSNWVMELDWIFTP